MADWPEFLKAALEHERDAANRFSLLYARIEEQTAAVDDATVDDFVSTFVQAAEHVASDRFFEPLHLLGAQREQAALLQAAKLVNNDNAAWEIAEHLLRAVFEDRRSGWGHTTMSLLNEDGSEPPQMDMMKMALYTVGRLILWKMFPFLLKRRLKSPLKGIRKITYRGLTGDAPLLPSHLNQPQKDALAAVADQPAMWKFRTNLWQLFGLPDTADGLRRLVRERA
jgi:hypothetical protein